MSDPMRAILANEKLERDFFRAMKINPEKFGLTGTVATRADSAPASDAPITPSAAPKRKRLRKRIGAPATAPQSVAKPTAPIGARARPGKQSGFAPAAPRKPKYP